MTREIKEINIKLCKLIPALYKKIETINSYEILEYIKLLSEVKFNNELLNEDIESKTNICNLFLSLSRFLSYCDLINLEIEENEIFLYKKTLKLIIREI